MILNVSILNLFEKSTMLFFFERNKKKVMMLVLNNNKLEFLKENPENNLARFIQKE